MTTRQERAAQLTEWLKHFRDAQRFGSQHPHQIANILTWGRPEEPARTCFPPTFFYEAGQPQTNPNPTRS